MANENAKTLTIGGITRQIEDEVARQGVSILQAAISTLTSRIDTLIGSGNVQGAIDTFNEVVEFLNGINSSETLAAKLLLKADKATTYTKTETDEAIADAVEGLGGGSVESVTINGTNHTPTNGVVDLGTIVGQQGPKGDTVVLDPEGLSLFEIANNLDSSDPTQGLSARQGKILKQKVEALWTKVNALINDLAAMAFTGSNTQGLGNIDWTGGTFYATVVYGTMTGCTATDNTDNGQIAEGTQLTIQLTALSNYTLTGADISVTDSRGQSVAYTLANNTITIAGTNVVGTINISVTAVAVYSVTNNDTHATLSNSTPANPVHGGSWSGTLTASSGYGLSANPSVTMGGVAVDFTASGNSWNRGTGAMTIGNVTGDIVILEAAVEVVAHTITKKLLNVSSSNTTGDTTDPDFGYKMQSVEDGDSYSTTLAAVSGATSNNDVVVKMGGVDITSSAYDSSTGVVNIPSVTGDVVIVATAATGVIKVTSNAAVTGGITINGTAHDLAVGDTTINGITAITALAFSADAKTAITALDFGGATSGMEIFSEKFKNFTSLTDFYGLVITSSCQNFSMTFQGCTNLETLSTIGWCPVLRYIGTLVSGCAKLEALDLSGISFLNNCDSLYSIAAGCKSMTKLVLPATEVPSITDLRTMFSGSHITHVDMSDLVLTGVTNMSTMLSNAQIGTLDIRGINTSTTGPTSLQFASQNAVIGTLIIGQLDMARVTDISFTTTKISRIVCTTATPPTINPEKNWVSQQEDVQIYVPASAVETYKAATGWSAVAGRIHSINEYSE